MTIGDKIKLQRKRLGLTQTELGERLGVKTNAVSKWECGRVEDIPTSKIKAMAALFEVPPSYLIDNNEPAPVDEGGPKVPEGYERLTPANRAIVDRLIADLAATQSGDAPSDD